METDPTNVPQPTSVRSVLKPHVPRNRSRISNQREILPGIDQRLAISRRYRDLVNACARWPVRLRVRLLAYTPFGRTAFVIIISKSLKS